MLPSLILALREGVEATLVISILFGVLRKLNRPDLTASIWWGVLSAFVVSTAAAVGLTLAGASLEGPAEVIFEGTTLLAAAGLLTWMIVWMHGQSRSLGKRIEQNMRLAIGKSGKRALFGVAFLAVVREGIELALFLIAAGLASGTGQELGGAVIGLALAAGLGFVLFSSTRRLPLGNFFMVTNVLLVLFAAGLFARGIHEFTEIGWIPVVIEHVYNIGPVLNEGSTMGQLLRALFGYSASPSLAEVVAYLAYFAVIALRLFRFPSRAAVRVSQG